MIRQRRISKVGGVLAALHSSFLRPFSKTPSLRRPYSTTQTQLTPRLYTTGDPLESSARIFSPSLKEGEFSVLPASPVPPHVQKPEYATNPTGVPVLSWEPSPDGHVHSEVEVAKIRLAAKIAQKALRLAMRAARPGITGEQIDHLVHSYLCSEGCYPGGINYYGFPKALCMSVNEVACHGIPSLRPLVSGDIVSFDVTLFRDGVYGDNCGTALVGEVDAVGRRLVETAERCVETAASIIRPGLPLNQVGETIEEEAREAGFCVVRDLHGHFIGREMHLPPLVPSVGGYHRQDVRFKKGQTFTVEPMISEGNPKLKTWKDGWTLVTLDNGRVAQHEHMCLLHEDGVEILTRLSEEEEREIPFHLADSLQPPS
uniref:Methionine aminopeptidase n=1 Tax=Chromera velia CCMP2878 TaxID=1169474 RepID=A0A0G4HIF7_9ALVE|mmetsp:Transcript_6020/g.11932  ORF Transcript_6020/g.11932 Transcript_6020/m.11932 type:complete len:372 (+) Transcript_6020:197-1312(+)|eukprot:Cvel_27950.t1-p1 / transcript=Cvel_27950.t1 / gene=Cvel_27950 / organism=Chromera_velia_CCMP2878 / gene_product=Methionine aminopeptidase 1, putative / transcript_product=Methionine aminopeptidase 1, putative / location=Cvel_scaffold3567:9086-10198(+) / protein_length=371 / sequence_SO=supercontig / SO=protein_coding / is_pseudo=false